MTIYNEDVERSFVSNMAFEGTSQALVSIDKSDSSAFPGG
jgi:hypothetical protein